MGGVIASGKVATTMDAILRFLMPGVFERHTTWYQVPLPDGTIMWCSDDGNCTR